MLSSYKSAATTLAGDRLGAAGAVEGADAFAAIFGAQFTHGWAQARVGIGGTEAGRSGAVEGVGAGRRPAPVQIDDSGRREPFSGL